MKTNNTEGLTMFEINVLVQQGGRFIMFPYLSGLVKKIKTSNIYFLRPEEKPFKYALKHFFLNFNFSLRQFPQTPIYIAKSIYFLIRGGKDYTHLILQDLNANNAPYKHLSF